MIPIARNHLRAIINYINKASSEQSAELKLSALQLSSIPLEVTEAVDVCDLDLSNNYISSVACWPLVV